MAHRKFSVMSWTHLFLHSMYWRFLQAHWKCWCCSHTNTYCLCSVFSMSSVYRIRFWAQPSLPYRSAWTLFACSGVAWQCSDPSSVHDFVNSDIHVECGLKRGPRGYQGCAHEPVIFCFHMRDGAMKWVSNYPIFLWGLFSWPLL